MKGSPGDAVLTISIWQLSLRFKNLVALDDFQGSHLGDRSALGQTDGGCRRMQMGGSPTGNRPFQYRARDPFIKDA